MFVSVSNPVSRFFIWWGSELSGVLSTSSAEAFEDPGRYTVQVLETGGYRLIELKKKNAAPPSGSDAVLSLSDMMTLLGSLGRSGGLTSVAIRLPNRACFTRNVVLPGAAARNFRNLLSLELERSTPFKKKDVYTGHTINQSQNGVKQSVRHHIVKRSLVDGLKSDIEALGIDVEAVECLDPAGRPLPVNFLDDGTQKQKALGLKATAALVASAVALATSAVYVDAARQQSALSKLQAETARLKVEAQSVRNLTAKYRSTVSAIATFNRLRKETVSRVSILEELTRILPDSAWVSDIKISGSTVDISGLATSASSIVPILEKSSFFVDATSTAPLTFDPLQDKERYGIRMRLRNVPVATEQSAEDQQ